MHIIIGRVAFSGLMIKGLEYNLRGRVWLIGVKTNWQLNLIRVAICTCCDGICERCLFNFFEAL